MKQINNATPRPWKYSPYHKSIQSTEISKDGCVLKIADLDLASYGVNEANAALIVRAVNNHDALIEALKIASKALDMDNFTKMDFQACKRAIDNALETATNDLKIERGIT